MHDLVIRGGTIVDGTGRPAFIGDVAVDGTKITAVGGRADHARDMTGGEIAERRDGALQQAVVPGGEIGIRCHLVGVDLEVQPGPRRFLLPELAPVVVAQ